MKIYRIIFLFFFILPLQSKAEKVDTTVAKIVVRNFIKPIIQESKNSKVQDIKLKLLYEKTEYINDLKDIDEYPLYYVYGFNENSGFVIVAADDRVNPIIGYSLESSFSVMNQPSAFIYWINKIEKQILYAIEKNVSQKNDISIKWNQLKGVTKGEVDPTLPICGPLLVEEGYTFMWDQGKPYNRMCPTYDTIYFTPPETRHAKVGCVAVAMGQLMKYWNYPIIGNDSHSYIENEYGLQSVNFMEDYYDWEEMSYSLNIDSVSYSIYDTAIYPIPELLYHCGVSVEMDYGEDGSGANVDNIPFALTNYFRYSDSITTRSLTIFNFPDKWISYLKDEIINKRPVIYKAVDLYNLTNHAFICDGYDSDNNFHFNWGWGGLFNGFYSIYAIDPYIYEFETAEQIFTGIEPRLEAFTPDKFENDNNISNARWITTDQLQIHSIVPLSDTDWLKFTIDQPSIITLSTTGIVGDTEMWLFKEDGITEINHDDNGGEDYFSKIVHKIESGIYYVKIEEKGNNDYIGSYTFQLSLSELSSTDGIVELEYFLNNDPGFGNANSILVNPSESISSSFNIPLNIQMGFHAFYVRAKDSHGKWSFTHDVPFYHLEIPSGSNLTEVEYFVDEDPGLGNGSKLSIVPSTEINKSFNLSLNSISVGFHTLYIRVKDSKDKWSMTHKISFYKVHISPIPSLSSLEYYIDYDPGFGNGTALSLSSSTEITKTFNLDLSDITTGFHRLYIRAQYQNGNWSVVQSRTFYRLEIPAQPNITDIECFLDQDPGLGSGNNIPVLPPIESLNMTYNLDLSDIDEGNHMLYIRVKDSSGRWSMTYVDSVMVTKGLLLIEVIGPTEVCQGDTAFLKAPTEEGLSYAWEKDEILIPNETDSIYYALQSGDYAVIVNDNVSYIDTSEIETITVNPVPLADAGSNQEVCYGESVTLTATGGTDYVWDNNITNGVPFYPTGTTDYHVMVTNEYGCSSQDSVTVIVNELPDADGGRDFEICYGDTITLTVSGGISYSWDNNVSDGVPFSPASTSDYHVTVTDENNCSDIDTVTVVVHPLPLINLGSDTTISTNDTLLLNAGSEFISCLWNNDSTTQTISVDGSVIGIGTYTYYVTTANEFGCLNSDTIVITIEPFSGINNSLADHVLVYPNPSTGKINILFVRGKPDKAIIEILNIVGEAIALQEIPKVNYGNLYEIDLSNKSKGVYFIQIYHQNQIVVKKVIIQ